jgi:glyceraldehyde 3-phosphate dehydrogenase
MDNVIIMCKFRGAMVKIGFHGLGRVGRAILRRCVSDPGCEVVAVNELDPDVDHLAYSLNHDSVHGTLAEKFVPRDGKLWMGDRGIAVFNEP